MVFISKKLLAKEKKTLKLNQNLKENCVLYSLIGYQNLIRRFFSRIIKNNKSSSK